MSDIRNDRDKKKINKFSFFFSLRNLLIDNLKVNRFLKSFRVNRSGGVGDGEFSFLTRSLVMAMLLLEVPTLENHVPAIKWG